MGTKNFMMFGIDGLDVAAVGASINEPLQAFRTMRKSIFVVLFPIPIKIIETDGFDDFGIENIRIQIIQFVRFDKGIITDINESLFNRAIRPSGIGKIPPVHGTYDDVQLHFF
jgi:hypothetical protein